MLFAAFAHIHLPSRNVSRRICNLQDENCTVGYKRLQQKLIVGIGAAKNICSSLAFSPALYTWQLIIDCIALIKLIFSDAMSEIKSGKSIIKRIQTVLSNSCVFLQAAV